MNWRWPHPVRPGSPNSIAWSARPRPAALRHRLPPTLPRAPHGVPDQVDVCARLAAHCSVDSGGAAFAIETGADFAIGTTTSTTSGILCSPGMWRLTALDLGQVALRQTLVERIGAMRDQGGVEALLQSLDFDVGIHTRKRAGHCQSPRKIDSRLCDLRAPGPGSNWFRTCRRSPAQEAVPFPTTQPPAPTERLGRQGRVAAAGSRADCGAKRALRRD